MSLPKSDSWNPQQYDKFKAQRSQPFYDLISLLEPVKSPRVVDLGCGTGELTSELHKAMGSRLTTGIDSSESMLAEARELETPSLKFEAGKIETWNPTDHVDIILSNAAIQWCDHHEVIFARLAKSLEPGGQIAVQMPMNHDYPTHVLADEMSREPKWAARLSGVSRDQDKSMLSVEGYASLLFNLGFERQKVFLRVYGHELESRAGVIEWVKGTLLTFFESRLSHTDFAEFTQEFRERLFKILPDDQPFFYPFKRVLIWGRL